MLALPSDDSWPPPPSDSTYFPSTDGHSNPRVKREPRFPFQFSPRRSRALRDLPHQAAARESFVNKAKELYPQPTGRYYCSSSASESNSDEHEHGRLLMAPLTSTSSKVVAAGRKNVSQAPTVRTTVQPHNLNSSHMTSSEMHDRHPSNTASDNINTTTTTDINNDAARFIDKLERRIREQNPHLRDEEVTILLLRTARETYVKAYKREEAGTKLATNSRLPIAAVKSDAKPKQQEKKISPSGSGKVEKDAWGAPVRSQRTYSQQSTWNSPCPDPQQASDVESAWKEPPASSSQDYTTGSSTQLSHPDYYSSSSDASSDDEPPAVILQQQSKTCGRPGQPLSIAQGAQHDPSSRPFSSCPSYPASQTSSTNHSEHNGWGDMTQTSVPAPSSPEQWPSTQDPYNCDSDYDIAGPITSVPQREVLEGSGDKKQWVKKFFCNFEGCAFSCVRLREMYNHKVGEHFVCERCDLEFASADALAMHKQAAKDHYFCTICKSDFATSTARNRHVETHHPQKQHILCPSCGTIHQNMTSFMRHLEEIKCPNVTQEQFEKARRMVGKMKDVALVEFPGDAKGTQAARLGNQTELLDDEDEDYPGLPGLDLRESKAIARASNAMPHVSHSVSALGATSNFVKKLQNMSVSDPMVSIELLPKEKRLWQLYQRMVGPSGTREPQVPVDADGNPRWAAVPEHDLYNPAVFHNTHTDKYNCPHPFCYKVFPDEVLLDRHLRSPAHRNQDLRCPECCDSFKTATALVAHLEAPSRYCGIKQSEVYREALEVASGAFLGIEEGADGKLKVVASEPSW